MAERPGTPVAPADLYFVRRSMVKQTVSGIAPPERWRVWRGRKWVSVAFGTELEALKCLEAILEGERKG